MIFGIYMKFPIFQKNIWVHRSSITEVIDSIKCAYLNAQHCFFLKTFSQWTCELVQKTPEICRKVLSSDLFFILRQTDFEKVIFNQIWDFTRCSITRWVETTSILVVIESIYRYQFKSNDLKNHRVFAIFVLTFWYLHEISNVLKKNITLIG